MQNDTTEVATAAGAKVLGSVRMPLNTSDYSSFLFQAQSSGAKAIGIAAAGADAVNCIKQAAEFQISARKIVAPIILFLTDIHALGLQAAKGLTLSETFYWDLNDGTRAFSDRFAARLPSRSKPTMVQAGVYSAVLHYLKAIAVGSDAQDGAGVVAAMKKMPTSDPLFGQGMIQANGRKIHPVLRVSGLRSRPSPRGPWELSACIDRAGTGCVSGSVAFRLQFRVVTLTRACERKAPEVILIDAYFWRTPNGWKITIALEEMELPYRIVPVDIYRGRQNDESFLRISPNGRIPANVDNVPTDGGEPVSVFEVCGHPHLFGREIWGRFLPTVLESGECRSGVG